MFPKTLSAYSRYKCITRAVKWFRDTYTFLQHLGSIITIVAHYLDHMTIFLEFICIGVNPKWLPLWTCSALAREETISSPYLVHCSVLWVIWNSPECREFQEDTRDLNRVLLYSSESSDTRIRVSLIQKNCTVSNICIIIIITDKTNSAIILRDWSGQILVIRVIFFLILSFFNFHHWCTATETRESYPTFTLAQAQAASWQWIFFVRARHGAATSATTQHLNWDFLPSMEIRCNVINWQIQTSCWKDSSDQPYFSYSSWFPTFIPTCN